MLRKIALWVVTVLMFAVFFFSGYSMFRGYGLRLFLSFGWPRWLLDGVAGIEMIGGAFLLLPWLAPFAVVPLVVVSLALVATYLGHAGYASFAVGQPAQAKPATGLAGRPAGNRAPRRARLASPPRSSRGTPGANMNRLIFVAALTVLSAPAARAETVCDGRYHWIDVPGTKCFDGTATGFQYICLNGSAAGPLMIYLEGGGGCGDGDTCDCQPDAFGNCTSPTGTFSVNHWDRAESFDGQEYGQEQSGSSGPEHFGQDAAFNGPTSPINRDWNILHIPYCTADVHAGDRERGYTTSDGRTYRGWHRGFTNVALDMLRARNLFPNPGRIAVMGSSAGGFGADCHLATVRDTWPTVPTIQLNNVGSPFSPAWTPGEAQSFGGTAGPLVPGSADWFRSWGAWHSGAHGDVVPDTCPSIVAPDATEWGFLFVQRYNQVRFPDVRKGFTDDYDDSAFADPSGYACLLDRDNADCTGDQRRLLQDAGAQIGRDDPNYRVYFHQGICHGERLWDGNSTDNGSDPSCDWDVTATSGMVQDGVAFRDWFTAWITGGPGFVNVY
jgi:uncharacterized membrane protein YphA (DoxX/SURF4 family)